MRQIVSRIVVLIVMALGAASTAAAQDNGRIVGRVIDEDQGSSVTGATVEVVGTTRTTTSGLDGRFTLADIPAGTVTLRVRMLGYAPKTVTGIPLAAGGVVEQVIGISRQALQLAEISVNVEAERGSVHQALDEQRSATNVMSAVTAEQIRRSPDGDAAAAAQRVSGVTVQEGKFVFVRGLGERYTTTTLNGSRIPSPEPERKSVPLDLFPSGLLQSITTAKTFTPNLQGDFSGGQVDIRTREYPTTRQIGLSISSGFTGGVTGSTLPMAPTEGGEWYASATAPRRIPAVVRETVNPVPGPQTNAMVNAMRNAWSVAPRSARPSSSLGMTLGGNDLFFGQRVGYVVSGSYSLSDEAQVDAVRESLEGDHYEGTVGRQSVLLGGLLNLSTMLGNHSRISLNTAYNRSADNEARLEQGFYENHGTNIEIQRLKYVERSVTNGQLVAQHQLSNRHRLDWAVSLSKVSRQEPDRSEFVRWLDPSVPTWYNQEGAFRAYGGLTENAFEASADYRVDLDRHGRRVVRVGVLTRTTDRDAFDAGYAIRTRDWTPTDTRWQGEPEAFFDGRFSTNGETLFELGIFNAGGNYQAEDRIQAGYAMAEWELLPGLRLIGGARIEHSELEVAYEDVLRNTGVAAPKYTDVLPAATFVLDLGTSQKVRLSASQTLARPEYREIAPICYRSGLGEEQRCGNPDLVRTLIQNFDLRWELYPSPGELISVAVFAKRFDNPIEPRYQGRSGTNSLWFENAESAINRGVELELMRGLRFLSRRLDAFSAFANATLMHSEVRTGVEGDPPRAMTGQAPYVVNAGLTWASSGRRASATILYNVVGERIVNARPSGQAVADMLELARPGLDLSVRFPVFGDLSGRADLKNLLNSPYEVRQGELLRAFHRTGRGVSVGFSWSP